MYDKQLKSHASMPNNQRIVELFMAADAAALKCVRKFHISTISAYFGVLEQCYGPGVAPIIDDDTTPKIEKLRKQYYELEIQLLEDPTKQKAVYLAQLLRVCRLYNTLLNTGLSSSEFFFRKNIQSKKGLAKIDFFSDSVFGSFKRKEELDDDETNEDN